MSSRLAEIVAGFKTGFWSHRSSGFVGEKRCSRVNIKVLFSFNNVCVEKNCFHLERIIHHAAWKCFCCGLTPQSFEKVWQKKNQVWNNFSEKVSSKLGFDTIGEKPLWLSLRNFFRRQLVCWHYLGRGHLGSGVGSVGRAVASDTRYPQFKS